MMKLVWVDEPVPSPEQRVQMIALDTPTHLYAWVTTSEGVNVTTLYGTLHRHWLVARFVEDLSSLRFRCRCGCEFELTLGKYGCPNCEGHSGAAWSVVR